MEKHSEEVIALYFGNDDNIIWLILLIIILVNFIDKKECAAAVPKAEKCEVKEEPVYIYRNPNRNKARRRLEY